MRHKRVILSEAKDLCISILPYIDCYFHDARFDKYNPSRAAADVSLMGSACAFPIHKL